MKSEMSGDSWLILELGAALLAMALFSVFFTPSYPKAFDRITDVLAFAFTAAVTYKWGRSMPQQASDPKPGQTSQSTVTTQAPDILPEKPNGK